MNLNYDDCCVIVPAYNEEKVISSTIDELKVHFRHIVCVDDSSTDNSAKIIARKAVILLEHSINLGQGGALQTGLEYARTHLDKVKYFVTFDADGQHRVEDILNMVKLLRQGKYDVILGSRFIASSKSSQIPRLKRLVLKAGIVFTNRTAGITLTDTHNGLRAFNRAFAEQLNITMNDMSHASQIVEIIAKSGMRWCETPVVINYTEYSRKKGQSMLNAINIGIDTLLRRWIT